MRFESLTAHAFGPFAGQAGGKTLRFAPGMNIVHGSNESGKSTLHAALFAGLCGMRRGRGAPRAEEQAFTALHKPWDHESWDVAAVVTLADDRRIELRHNLALRTCRAIDEITGQEYDTGQIVFDGAPDGSRWLGLDRHAFLATACVRQSELLAVLNEPSLLQDHLQRAAATGGADETAANALARIDAYQRDQVGLDRANAVRPLRRAKERLEQTKEALRTAQLDHARYLDLAAHADELERYAAMAERALLLAEAKIARAEAGRWRARLDRALELAARFPGGAPPSGADDDSVAQEATGALATWAAVPNLPSLDGETTEEIRARIAALPAHPHGDTEVHPEVARARASLEAAVLALRGHAAAGADTRSTHAAHPMRLPLLGAGGLVAAGGIGALAAGMFLAGVVLLVLGLTLAGAGLFLKPGGLDEASRAAARQALTSAQDAAASGLASVLRARGIEVAGDPLDAAERYGRECHARAEQASRAAQREPLERQLRDREAREAAAADAERRRAAAVEQLRQSASRCGCPDTQTLDAVRLVRWIEQWRTERSAAIRDRDQAQSEWAELQNLLEGRQVEDLEAEVAGVEERAVASAKGLEPAEIDALVPDADSAAQVARLSGARNDAAGEWERARGQVIQLRQQVPDVAAAEEVVAESEEELARVQQLDRTLTLTAKFLKDAQANVHRSIAPVLQAAVERWLPTVTAGRYRHALVDPQTLRVTVRDLENHPRDAALLSRGTAEQIYLLLRTAMAQHLTKPGEVCPLILDDVTVHCDAFRKPHVLAALHALSEERQIILFSQDESVLAWAESTLSDERDRIERLSAAPVAA
ncbi:MAG: AAA family ATPase [Chloroflexi bacterium]|nr:AAA family ATPase [Chloroflexota bacterium]